MVSDKNPTKETILKDVFSAPLPGEKQSNGDPLRVQDVLKGDKTRIANGENLNILLKEYTSSVFDPNKAPGIKITVLGLKLDLASANLRVALAESEYLKDQTKLLEKTLVNTNTLKFAKQRLVDRLDPNLATSLIPIFNKKDRPRVTINNLLQKRINKVSGDADKREIEKAIQGALIIVEEYSISHMLDDPALARLEVKAQQEILSHAHSIQVSAGIAAKREAIISRGLESLSMYYAGGWKQEDTAALIQAAQTIGLGWIAGGVN